MNTTQTQLQNNKDAAQNGNTEIEVLTGEGSKTEKKLRQRARNAENPQTTENNTAIEVL